VDLSSHLLVSFASEFAKALEGEILEQRIPRNVPTLTNPNKLVVIFITQLSLDHGRHIVVFSNSLSHYRFLTSWSLLILSRNAWSESEKIVSFGPEFERYFG
jgi:hypothetical protein